MGFFTKYFYVAFLFVYIPTQAQDLTSGLIAWYKFDGDTKDASNSAKHGVPHNVTFGQGKCGDQNSAIYLNGRDAYVDLPLATSLNGKQQLTITAWVKPIRFNNIQYTLKSIYSHWIDYGAFQPIGILFGVSPDSSVVSAFSGGYQVSSTNDVVRSNEWQLVVLRFDGTKAAASDRALFQVNCSTYGPTCNTMYSTCSATPSSIGSMANYTYIGTRKDDLGKFVDYFEGYIDEIRLYDRILTKDELNQLFLLCGPLSCDDNNCLTEDQVNPNTCKCEHIAKPKPNCDDNNCQTEDSYNIATCACEHITKPQPDCNDNNSQTDDSYNVATCMCEHNLNSSNSSKPGVYLPSAFTPNKDGFNDVYKPIYRGVGSAILTIYDRWGEVIFHGNNLTDGWDGTYCGITCMQGIYQYLIKGIYDTGEEFTFQGSILLIK